MRLLQLQERQRQLLREMRAQMELLRGAPGDVTAALDQLDRDTDSLEANMAAIRQQITNLKFFLNQTEESSPTAGLS